MSTIHFNQTTTLTPEEYVAGLTDFGPGRSKVFSKSADDYPEVGSLGPDRGAQRARAMSTSLFRGYRQDGGNAAFSGWESSEGLVEVDG